MKSKRWTTIRDGKIHSMADATHPRELEKDEMPLTMDELAIVRACNGDLNLAKNIIHDIESRMAIVAASMKETK